MRMQDMATLCKTQSCFCSRKIAMSCATLRSKMQLSAWYTTSHRQGSRFHRGNISHNRMGIMTDNHMELLVLLSGD